MILYSPKDLALIAISQRKKLGLTQSDVAERVGLKQKTISAFENRPGSVMLLTALLIISALDLELDLTAKNESSAKLTKWSQEW
jgi:HTH-type transcriptional regulator/antitoxin HipB